MDTEVKERVNPSELDDPYGTKAIHQYYLPIMDEMAAFCSLHDIRYSLSGGTLLGAVRHKGFIPWDDDMDLMFDRSNYEKFLSAFEHEPLMEYEIVGSTWVKRLTRRDNPLKFEEKQCIDLFVFDHVPKNKIAAKMKIFLLRTFQGMMKDHPEYSRFSLFYKILLFVTWLVGRLFTKKWKYQMYHKISQIGGGSGKINAYNTWYDQIGRLEFDESIFQKYCQMEFEKRHYMVIQGYDHYLTTLYGDYMTPPSPDKRIPTH